MWFNYHDAIEQDSDTRPEAYTKSIFGKDVRSSSRHLKGAKFESEQKKFLLFIQSLSRKKVYSYKR
jgi:hypothetical protein